MSGSCELYETITRTNKPTSGMLPCISVLRSSRKHSTQYTDTAYGLSLIRYMENPKNWLRRSKPCMMTSIALWWRTRDHSLFSCGDGCQFSCSSSSQIEKCNRWSKKRYQEFTGTSPPRLKTLTLWMTLPSDNEPSKYQDSKAGRQLSKCGMKLNAKKYNVLKLHSKSEASLTVEISGAEEVDSFLYTLGPMLQRAVRAGLTPGRE